MENRFVIPPFWGRVSLVLVLFALAVPIYAQKNKPAANLEQLRNGSFSAPEDPGSWTTGNTGSSNSHYAEAMSATYRAILTNLDPNSSITLTLEYDVQHSEKLALDYLTSYDRIQPHFATFGHDQEEVNPTLGTDLFQSPPEAPDNLFPIPIPSVLNSPVAGQPVASFNNVAGAGQAEMAIWNGTINNIAYVGSTPDLSDPSNQSQQIEVTFISGSNPSGTIVLAWGGHIASRTEWGFDTDGSPRSAGGISGSPYHMRLKSWNLGNLGNKDLSLSIDLVSAPDIPLPPDNFTASPVSIDQIDLSWDQVSSSKTLTYILERSPTGNDSWVQIASLPQTTTTYSDQGLSEFTKYFYRISASNSDGTSGFATTMARTLSVLSSATNLNGKSGDKIGFELTSLAQGTAGENPSQQIYQIRDSDGAVLIEVIAFLNPNTIEAVITLLQTIYGRVAGDFLFDPQFYIDNNRNLIDLYFDIARLEELNLEEILNFARPVVRTFTSSIGATGVLSQGDSAQTTNEVRLSFKVPGMPESKFVDGSGIDILVFSNSFNTEPFSGSDSRYVTDQKNLDLPGLFNPNYPDPVQVLHESPVADTDEGRAMLQIIHDAAPGAKLGFYSGTQSLNTFAQGIETASLDGWDLMVDDITFLVEPFFRQEGPVYDAINDHINRAPGNMHFSSAGNFADQAIEGILNFVPLPVSSDAYETGNTAFIHDNGGGDLTTEIFANVGEYVLVFQWDEPFASMGDSVGATFDLDMFIVNDSLEVMAGNNRINFAGDAAEILILNASAPRAANLIFTCDCDTPPTNLAFRMIAFKIDGDGDGLVFTDPISGPTVSGHAAFDIPNLITTGASFYGFYSSSTEIEPFSSLGAPGKVDITGPDGANINVNTIGSDINFDPDIFNNFFGTSASAPHIAAAYAVMLEAIPAWYDTLGVPAEKINDPSFATGNPADQATGLFTQTAFSIGNPLQSGAGLLQAEDAFKVIAAQTPLLTGFTLANTSMTISVDTVVITLQGDYFTEASQVFLDGDSVETTFISETELQVTIPPFSGMGSFVIASAPSATPSGEDGGESNALDLLDGRRAITIVTDNQSRTFGQDYDNLTFSVQGLVGDETYDSLELPDVILTSTAVGLFPDVGNYIITPSLATPLTEEQQDEFIVAFQPGVLSFTPLSLTIQPMDTSAFYGEEPVIVMNYLYDSNGISDNITFLNTLKSEHESTYLVDSVGGGLVNRFSAVVNRFSAVVNENPGRLDELLNLIENSNWMATETSILNRFSAVVNDFNIVPVDADQLLDYLDDPLVGNSASIENRFSAVVNGTDLVTGLTYVYDPIENRFSAVVNRFSAVVNRFSAVVNVPLGDENDSTDLSETLAIIDAEDGGKSESDTVNVFSINLITGLDVTITNEGRHYMVSGAALAPVFTNCIVTYQTGRLAIDPLPLIVDLDDGEEVPIVRNYGDPNPVYTSTTSPLAYKDEIEIVYNLNPVPASTNPVSAGTWAIEQGATITDSAALDVTSNYDITFINGTLTVNPATLVLNTEDVLINEGEDLPVSEIITTIIGYAANESENDVFPGGANLTYSSPEYETAGRAAGTYLLLTDVSPDPENYTVVDNTAQLFVNLADGKKIRVFFDCGEANKDNNAEFPFTAYFSYENDNDVSIFIEPQSPDNQLIGTSFDASSLPFEFLPGSHQFPVPFEGELRYQVSTFGSAHNSSQQVDSDNLKGQKCKPGEILVNGRTANPDSGDALNTLNSEEVQFYPNPVNDRLVIRVNENFTSNDFELYDSQGIRHDVKMLIDATQSTVEFDFTNFDAGLYLLKLNIDGTTALIRILRQ